MPFLRILLVVVVVAYPFLVYLGLAWLRPGVLGALLAVILIARFVLTAPAERRTMLPLTATLVVLAAAVTFTNDERLLRLYPVVVNGVMGALFALTLWRPPSMIERFARLYKPDLPAEAVPYLRWVTLSWVVFFLINGSIALWTALHASLEVWAWYNGLISYLVIGVLLAVEWVIRGFYKRHVRRAGGA